MTQQTHAASVVRTGPNVDPRAWYEQEWPFGVVLVVSVPAVFVAALYGEGVAALAVFGVVGLVLLLLTYSYFTRQEADEIRQSAADGLGHTAAEDDTALVDVDEQGRYLLLHQEATGEGVTQHLVGRYTSEEKLAEARGLLIACVEDRQAARREGVEVRGPINLQSASAELETARALLQRRRHARALNG